MNLPQTRLLCVIANRFASMGSPSRGSNPRLAQSTQSRISNEPVRIHGKRVCVPMASNGDRGNLIVPSSIPENFKKTNLHVWHYKIELSIAKHVQAFVTDVGTRPRPSKRLLFECALHC